MSPLNFTHILTQAVDELSESESYKGLFHQHKDGEPLPSAKVLYEIIELSRAILFPGYYGNSTINSRTINYHIGVNIEKLFDLLTEQILAGLCFSTAEGDCNVCSESRREEAARLAANFISKLPAMRRILATDVEAAYNGDPAAKSYGEVIFCYPAIKAISNYRIAHELLELGVPLIPRMITEMAHSETGIDIHPGAKIGSHFTIDKHHREQCQIISGCHPGSKKLPAGCRRKTDQGYPPPPDTGRQCHSLLKRHHPWKNYYRKRRNRRRKYLGNGKHSRRSKDCTDKSKEIKSINYI